MAKKFVLWDGHLARPDRAGKMPVPQLTKSLKRKFRELALLHHESLKKVEATQVSLRRSLTRSA